MSASGPRHLDVELPQPILPSTPGAKLLLEVYSQQIVGLCEGLVADATAAACTDLATKRKAEGTLLRLHDALKAVESRRVDLKKPITQMGRAIDEIAAKLTAPMDIAKRSLQGRIVAFDRIESERVAAEQRAADEKARREHEDAIAAEKAKAAAEAKELAEVLGEYVEVAPKPVPEPVPTPIVATPKSTAVQVRVDTEVQIDDASLIPQRIGETVLMIPDKAAIKRCINLGITVPGCRLIEVERVAMVGRRQ